MAWRFGARRAVALLAPVALVMAVSSGAPVWAAEGWGSTGAITMGDDPVDIAIDQGKHRGYVANSDSGDVSVIDSRNGTNLKDASGQPVAIKVGAGPTGVAIDEGMAMVLVTNNASDTVSVINANTNMVIATISPPS